MVHFSVATVYLVILTELDRYTVGSENGSKPFARFQLGLTSYRA